MDRLFDNVDKPIEFASTHPFYPPPKDFIYNVAGVSANPGSREFHAYRLLKTFILHLFNRYIYYIKWHWITKELQGEKSMED